MPPKAVKQSDYAKTGIGSGAYRLKEWVPSERVVLEANPDYWGPKPTVNQVIFRTGRGAVRADGGVAIG